MSSAASMPLELAEEILRVAVRFVPVSEGARLFIERPGEEWLVSQANAQVALDVLLEALR